MLWTDAWFSCAFAADISFVFSGLPYIVTSLYPICSQCAAKVSTFKYRIVYVEFVGTLAVVCLFIWLTGNKYLLPCMWKWNVFYRSVVQKCIEY